MKPLHPLCNGDSNTLLKTQAVEEEWCGVTGFAVLQVDVVRAFVQPEFPALAVVDPAARHPIYEHQIGFSCEVKLLHLRIITVCEIGFEKTLSGAAVKGSSYLYVLGVFEACDGVWQHSQESLSADMCLEHLLTELPFHRLVDFC